MMLVCLAVMVVLQGLSVIVLATERATVDEATGRERLQQKDRALAEVRLRLAQDWLPSPPSGWTTGQGQVGEGQDVHVIAQEVEAGAGRLMDVRARQEPGVSRWVLSAEAERARDGLDLPLAAVVAETMTAAEGRPTAWVDVDWRDSGNPGDPNPGSCSSTVPCYLVAPVPGMQLAPDCVLSLMDRVWGLDEGWRSLAKQLGGAHEPGGLSLGTGGGGSESTGGTRAPSGGAQGSEETDFGCAAAAGADGVYFFAGPRQGDARIPRDGAGSTREAPLLVVVTGGADLDARDRGSLWGVLVVDGGSVRLDGTVLHGAVFAGGRITLGETGQVLYARSVLRWATDQSLRRVRLVPGTRWEAGE